MWCFSTLLYSSQHRCHHHLINIITTTPWHQFATFNYFILAFQTRGTSILLRLYCLGYLRGCLLSLVFCVLLLSYSQVSGLIHLVVFLQWIVHTGSKYKFTSKMSYLVSKTTPAKKSADIWPNSTHRQLTFDQKLPTTFDFSTYFKTNCWFWWASFTILNIETTIQFLPQCVVRIR